MNATRAIPVEIERKFLVRSDAWQSNDPGETIRQGYLANTDAVTVRVRLSNLGGTLTIKGRPQGLVTPEFEYPIPDAHATHLLDLCGARYIEKTRYRIPHAGHTWEVDVFEGANRGLVLAEIELQTETEAFDRPPWLGREVSDDPRFKNARLCLEPYRRAWQDAESAPES